MNYEHRQILRNKRDLLTKNINFKDLIPFLVEYKIFNRYMWNDVNSTADMLDALPHRGPKAFRNIIEILRKAKYNLEADILENHIPAKEISENNLFYSMSSQPLGFCFIINNVEFDKHNSDDVSRDRLGSDVDVKSLRSFFGNIGFEVTVRKNMKASEMIACLQEFSKRDFASIDSLIIIILSHGSQKNNKDIIYGTDWNHIFKTEVCDIFNNKNCEQLQNKPKVFFFICCRGNDRDYGVKKCLPNESIDSNSDIIMPLLSDIFIVHSTLPYQVSVRNGDNGTYFCEALINVLKENYQIHDLETMIKFVNRELQKKVSPVYRVVQAAHIEVFGATKKCKLCKS